MQADPLRCFLSEGKDKGMVSPGALGLLPVFFDFGFDFAKAALAFVETPLAAFFGHFLPPDFLEAVVGAAAAAAPGFATDPSASVSGMYVCVLAQVRAAAIS